MLSFKQCRAFLAIIDHKGFHKAAKSLGITQPALTMQINAMEKALGAKLFERQTRNILPTTAGRTLIPEIRAIVAKLDGLPDLLTPQHPLESRLRLGLIPTVGPYLLPKLLHNVRTNFPKLNFELQEQHTNVLVSQLRQGQLDLLLLALPLDENGLEEYPLFTEEFLLTTSADHPLQHKANVRMNDLTDYPLLLLTDGHCLREQALHFCKNTPQKSQNLANISATSLSTLCQMVASNLGITLLPETVAAVEAHSSSNLKTKHFSAPKPNRQVGLTWRRSDPRRQAFITLAKTLKSVSFKPDQR